MGDMANRLVWKLRRIAANLRQQDVASLVGISTTRYSAIERGEQQASPRDRELIERMLPELPSQILNNEK
jgi:transcriptional regulator with XRE-family HTH domain